MAEEVKSPEGGEEPVAAVEPVVEAVEAPPVAETAPEPVQAPVEADKPAEEAPATEEKPAEPEKPEEPAKDAATEEKPAEDPEIKPEAPVYAAFEIPEGFDAPAEQIEAFTGVLGKYGLSQEAGQELMNLHGEALKQAAAQLEQRQHDVFADTRRGWVKDFEKQAGNRRDTILNDAKFAVTDLIKDAKARQEVWEVFAFTGVGDHPAVINLLAKAGRRIREREAPAPGLPASPTSGSRADRRYGATKR